MLQPVGPTDQVRLVVLGGSAPATVQLIDALAARSADTAGRAANIAALQLVLHGRSPDRLAAVARAARLRADALDALLAISTQTDRAAALDGADVVLNQIRPGGLEQ